MIGELYTVNIVYEEKRGIQAINKEKMNCIVNIVWEKWGIRGIIKEKVSYVKWSLFKKKKKNTGNKQRKYDLYKVNTVKKKKRNTGNKQRKDELRSVNIV